MGTVFGNLPNSLWADIEGELLSLPTRPWAAPEDKAGNSKDEGGESQQNPLTGPGRTSEPSSAVGLGARWDPLGIPVPWMGLGIPNASERAM